MEYGLDEPRIPIEKKDFPLLQIVHIGSDPITLSCSMSIPVPLREQTYHVITLTTHNHLASGLRISGATPLLDKCSEMK